MALEVIGFGALNLDYVYQLEYPRLSMQLAELIRPGSELALAPGEFEHLLGLIEQGGTFMGKSGGGQAANTITALTRMGIACGYVGKVGEDKAGEYILDSLKGVDRQGIISGGHSGRCLSLLNHDGERCTLISPGCNDELAITDVNLDYLNQAQLVYFSSFVGDNSLNTQLEVVRRLKPQVAIALDPGELYAKRGLSALEELLNRCRMLFITEQEIEMLTGQDYKVGAKQILATGTQVVICKRGEKGAHVLSKEDEFELAIERVSAVDRTGAGDVFAAGFIAGWLKRLDLKGCTQLGHKAAIHSIKGVVRASYPDKEFLQELNYV